MKDLAAALVKARRLEADAMVDLASATARLMRHSRIRLRLEKQLGAAEVARIVNSEEAIQVITQKRDTVRATMKRLKVDSGQ